MAVNSSPRPYRLYRMLFCERSFGIFFLAWGLLLQANHFTRLAPHGSFLSHLESYAPGWVWGVGMILIGVGRYIAFRYKSARWRIRLSSFTLFYLWMIAFVAAWGGLWGATFPLALFVALLATEFHRMLARDIELGL